MEKWDWGVGVGVGVGAGAGAGLCNLCSVFRAGFVAVAGVGAGVGVGFVAVAGVGAGVCVGVDVGAGVGVGACFGWYGGGSTVTFNRRYASYIPPVNIVSRLQYCIG